MNEKNVHNIKSEEMKKAVKKLYQFYTNHGVTMTDDPFNEKFSFGQGPDKQEVEFVFNADGEITEIVYG